jgi:signal transduction histidine kinase
MDTAIWKRLSRQNAHEKQALAQHLHDRVAIPLSNLKLQINLACERSEKTDNLDILKDINRSLDSLLENTRIAIGELRPPILDDLGLSDALNWFRRELIQKNALKIHLTLSPDVDRLVDSYRTDLFHLFQILGRDLAPETQASTLRIDIRAGSDSIELEYRDDGLDIVALGQPAWDMLPLAKIRLKVLSLGGTVTLDRSVVKGNILHLSIPYDATLVESKK